MALHKNDAGANTTEVSVSYEQCANQAMDSSLKDQHVHVCTAVERMYEHHKFIFQALGSTQIP